MGEGFDVDPEAIREIGLELRAGLDPLVSTAGSVPQADAGLMTLVMERAVATLLEGLLGYSSKVAAMADDVVRSALQYHWSDQEAQASLLMLMVPGTTPEQAEHSVADAPGSLWAQVEDEQTGDLQVLLSGAGAGAGTGPSTTDGSHGDGLEALLLGPLEAGSGSSDHDSPGAVPDER